MKSITSIIFLSLMLLGLSANAQQGSRMDRMERMDPEKRAERQTARMTEELGLSEDQSQKVLGINLAAAKMMKEAFMEAGEDRSAMRETMMAIRDETTKELKTVLTDEQWTKFEAIQAERGGRMGRQGRGPGMEEGKKGKKGKRKKKKEMENLEEKSDDNSNS